MNKAIRRKVVRFEYREPVPGWGDTRHAVLECGHVHNLGRDFANLPPYAPKRMACHDCGLASIDGISVTPKVNEMEKP